MPLLPTSCTREGLAAEMTPEPCTTQRHIKKLGCALEALTCFEGPKSIQLTALETLEVSKARRVS